MAGTPLTDAINALTTYSNTVTGASDTTLSEAVATLASGYGGGSGDALYNLINATITDAEIDWSKVSAPKEGAFQNCTALTSIDNPTIDDIRSNIFRGCTGLTSAEFTCARQNPQYGQNVFTGCTNLKEATIHFTYAGNSNTVLAGTYFYNNCTLLETVIYTVANNKFAYNSNWMMPNCPAVRNMVIKSNSVASLNGGWNANAWGGIYNNPAQSTIYVPEALITSYQNDNAWGTLYAAGVTFAKIEGSIYE